VVEVAISDPKKAGEYTETMSKAMEYFNENGSHPILSSKLFLPFGKSAAIEKSRKIEYILGNSFAFAECDTRIEKGSRKLDRRLTSRLTSK
jgi:hypothetical protein